MNKIPRKPALETPEERELRLKSLALLAKLNPLLGTFYASPDLVIDALDRTLSPLNISRLNEAFNKLNSGGDLDDKQKKVLLGIIKACLLMNLKGMKEFLGEERFSAFIILLTQGFIDTYVGANFRVPESIMVPKDDEGEDGDDKKDEDDSSKSPSPSSDSDDDDSDDKEGGDGDGDSDDDDDAEESDEDSDAESKDMESTSKDQKEIRYLDSTTLIVMDLIKFMKKLNWEQICKRLIQIRDVKSFESKSADEIVSTRLTFRTPKNMSHLSRDQVYKYEIVLAGNPIGLIHTTQHSDNTDNKRIWMVSLRNHFQDAYYKSGYSDTEPFTVVKGDNIVLHNLQLMTMAEARSWVRTVVEK